MQTLARTQPFFAVRFDGAIYDCGAKIGFLMATVAYPPAHKDLGPELRAELGKLLASQ